MCDKITISTDCGKEREAMNYLEGMQYRIKTAAEADWHFHPELEFIFVIEGQIRLEMQGRNDLLKKHDVVLINAGTRHAIHVQEKAIVCVVNYSWQLLSTMLGGEESIFACNSAAEHKRSYLKLQAIFQQLVYHAVSRKHKTNCLEQSLLYRLLDELVEYYLQGTRLHDSQEDLRPHKILRYVGANFQSNISLSALADEMFVSTSTLSRFFRKKTGIYFADYVNQVRLDYAAQELGRTDKNVTTSTMSANRLHIFAKWSRRAALIAKFIFLSGTTRWPTAIISTTAVSVRPISRKRLNSCGVRWICWVCGWHPTGSAITTTRAAVLQTAAADF